MISHWRDREFVELEDDVARCAYGARLLGRDEGLLLPGMGSVSIKISGKDIAGRERELVAISGDGAKLATITEEQFARLRRAPFLELAEHSAGDLASVDEALQIERTALSQPLVPPLALLHILLPHRVIFFTIPDALLALANTEDAAERLRRVYGDELTVISFASLLLPLAQAAISATDPERSPQALYLLGWGLLVVANDVESAHAHTIDIVTAAVKHLHEHEAWNLASLPSSEQCEAGVEVAALRGWYAARLGAPLLLRSQGVPSDAVDLRQHLRQGPPSVLYARHTTLAPLPRGGEERVTAAEQQPSNLLWDPGLGFFTVALTPAAATQNDRLWHHTVAAIRRAQRLGGYAPVSFEETRSALLRLQPAPEAGAALPFAGEVALVTGGASGIGKACVASLLARGAAVVSLDINPEIADCFDNPCYLGLECDLADEEEIERAFAALVSEFGGLDMLVLNAGVFPGGCRIDSLALDTWRRVMDVNLDANLVVLREAYPLLKEAPRHGRVVVNASKNVLAPGAGAAAYSSSKAALTQMARVAALEWASDSIRVNIVHPDAVFDTGIWTEEVLEARAHHYGISVQEYKTRNLLRVELDSHYVAELIAEMLGPLFGRITGAQIPVDGGSDRTI